MEKFYRQTLLSFRFDLLSIFRQEFKKEPALIELPKYVLQSFGFIFHFVDSLSAGYHPFSFSCSACIRSNVLFWFLVFLMKTEVKT
jgi:hypothetical protein